MPNQGPWSECNHCNNNMLAIHKHNASALFWYTQRYHGPRAAIKKLRGPCHDQWRSIMFDRICEVGLGWAFAGRGPWAMFLENVLLK